MKLVVVYGNEDGTIIGQQFLHELKAWIHHAAPLIVPSCVLAFLPDCMTYPFLELRLSEVIVVDPTLVSSIVRRIDVDAVNPTRVSWKQCFEGHQVVAFNDQVAIEPWLLAFTEDGELRIELKRVMSD